MPISRRAVLATSLAAFAPQSRAAQLTGTMKLTMPAPNLADQTLNFIALMGVEWITTSGPAGPTYTEEGRVIKQRPEDPEPPWKEDDLRKMKDRVESFGLKLGNLMLHDFRDAVLGRPGADKAIEQVCESIRVAGKVGIPIV